MKKPKTIPANSLRQHLADSAQNGEHFLWDANSKVSLPDLASRSCFGGRLRDLAGKSVFLATQSQIAAAFALFELDGIARRIIVCPPDLPSEFLQSIVRRGDVDAIASDLPLDSFPDLGLSTRVQIDTALTQMADSDPAQLESEWVLLTSGTTGEPKMLTHTLATLTPIKLGRNENTGILWGTFYDIRRYGGLQIFLRAVLGGTTLVFSDSAEAAVDHLRRLGSAGVTHISGTPTHWRRTLMSSASKEIAPRYIRLSGEIVDQSIINALRTAYPHAAISHAYASTEAGVGFEVDDGLEGFPASVLDDMQNIEIKIEDRSLRIRSSRTAAKYLGDDNLCLKDADGFVDTGDIVELRGNRYYFLGRRNGVINVAGLKVYPEEIESVIGRHPAVRMTCVRSLKSAITGSLVVADVLLTAQLDHREAEIRNEILGICRTTLPRYKVPVALNFVHSLPVASTGKIDRGHA